MGPKLAPLGRAWAPWHLVLRLRGAARAAAAPLMAPGGAGAARGSMRSIASNDCRRRTGLEGGTSPRLVGFRKSRKALWASVPFEELSVSGGHASCARYAHRERALRDPQRRPTDPPESALTSNYRSISGLELAGAAEFGALRRLRWRPRRQPAVSATARACPLLQTRPHPPPRPRAAASTASSGSAHLQSESS